MKVDGAVGYNSMITAEACTCFIILYLSFYITELKALDFG